MRRFGFVDTIVLIVGIVAVGAATIMLGIAVWYYAQGKLTLWIPTAIASVLAGNILLLVGVIRRRREGRNDRER